MSLKPLPIKGIGTPIMEFKKNCFGGSSKSTNYFKTHVFDLFSIFYLLSHTSETAGQAKLSVPNGFLAFLISLGVIVEFTRNFKAITIIFYGILIHWSTSSEFSWKGCVFEGFLQDRPIRRNYYCCFMQNWRQAAECSSPLNLTPLQRLTWILMGISES